MSDRTILLVEDNADDVELALHGFQKTQSRNNIVVARDGEEALDFLLRRGAHAERSRDEEPALVLLDLKLPGISGFEVLRQLRQVDPVRSIPVVVMSSSDDQGDISRSYSFGVNSYICKPVKFSDFSKMLEQTGVYWLDINRPSEA